MQDSNCISDVEANGSEINVKICSNERTSKLKWNNSVFVS